MKLMPHRKFPSTAAIDVFLLQMLSVVKKLRETCMIWQWRVFSIQVDDCMHLGTMCMKILSPLQGWKSIRFSSVSYSDCEKVADALPILDIMPVMFENISTITVVAKTTNSAVYHTAQIITSITNMHIKTRHFLTLFSVNYSLLWSIQIKKLELELTASFVPSSVCPCPGSAVPYSTKSLDLSRTLSRTVSVFSSSAALFEKLRKEKSPSRESIGQHDKEKVVTGGKLRNSNNGMLSRLKSSYNQAYI